MRSYASIAPTFWTRGTGKRLRGHKEAQIVAMYLMSAPATNMVGIFHLSLPTLCNDTGLTQKEALKGLARCLEEAFAYWDEAEELAFVPALAKHQLGDVLKEKDFKVKGVIRALAPFKGHRFYSMFIERYGALYHLPEEDLDSPIEGASKPHVPSGTRDYVLVPDQISDPDACASGVFPKADPKKSGRWKRFPADVEPDDTCRQLAAKLGVDLEYQMELIRDQEFNKPRTDAMATLRTWIRNSVKFNTATRPRVAANGAAAANGGADYYE